ncbi:Histone-lysine N-methyltransferase family member SUVH9 histone H3-K9 methyltransferase [Vigna angularis]|uniref:Histone-lysine N-methyltransferase family member SUVH9 histone H3-K9 methyltransferase n=1 Tax=Phaseolus angularis TaxID=3914 RepID=A0A8T0JI99_PHAAN|nr:Histone-lysine N-methyltransferase family member SUVH9 histone H3-K9 methyltransferase [Vigna angularis]
MLYVEAERGGEFTKLKSPESNSDSIVENPSKGGESSELGEGDVGLDSVLSLAEWRHWGTSASRLARGGAPVKMLHGGVDCVGVRVIRGMRYEGSASASGKVYVYDGVYKITECWFQKGKSGFGVYKFRLSRIEGQAEMGSVILKEARNIRRGEMESNIVRFLSADMTSFPQFVFHQSGNVTGCDCVNGCGDGCFCAMKNGGDFPYTLQGHLVKGKPLIFECGPFCSCPSLS